MICARLSPTLLRHWSVRHTQSFGTVTQQSDYTLEMKNLTLHNWIQKKKRRKNREEKKLCGSWVAGWTCLDQFSELYVMAGVDD